MPPSRAVLAGLVLLTACRPSFLSAPDATCQVGHVVGGITEPAAVTPVVPVRKRAWEASVGGEVAARPLIRARLSGWPSARRPRPLPVESRAFVQRVAEDTWRGLLGLRDREHHLPVDHVHLAPRDPGTPPVGDYTNVTTVGLWIVALAGATEIGLVSRDEAIVMLGDVLDTLERLETHDGLFFNYYDTTSLERTSNLLSFVDTAWLTAGLIVARQTFPELGERATALIARGDWRRFYDPRAGLMYHGWWVQPPGPSRYHYGVLYAESRIGSVLAIGLGAAPPSHWFRMTRTFPAACDWQTQTPRDRRRKTVLGETFYGGHYVWDDVAYVPSWGGSMFEALMPTLVLDEVRWAPDSLGANDKAHVTVQQRAGGAIWGASPSLRPDGAGYGEYGIHELGMLGYRPGAITPHASALAISVTPDAAVANLRSIASRFPAYGDWGFYDAVDPATGEVAESYLTLDQAMTFIALANHLCGGCVRQRFADDPIVARALPTIGVERFFASGSD